MVSERGLLGAHSPSSGAPKLGLGGVAHAGRTVMSAHRPAKAEIHYLLLLCHTLLVPMHLSTTPNYQLPDFAQGFAFSQPQLPPPSGPVPMTPSPGGMRYRCRIPAGK